MEFLAIAWIICAFFCAYIAAQKHRNGAAWFILGFLFFIFALIAIAAVPSLPEEEKASVVNVETPRQATPTEENEFLKAIRIIFAILLFAVPICFVIYVVS